MSQLRLGISSSKRQKAEMLRQIISGHSIIKNDILMTIIALNYSSLNLKGKHIVIKLYVLSRGRLGGGA